MGAEVLPASNVRGQWAEKISARWHKTRQGAIEVGRLLIEAKAQLGHGSFTAMIEADLPFGARTAQNLMKIAGDPRITNAKFTSLLPASWATLHEISQLDDSEFEAGINSGLIRPDMKQGEIRAANRQALKVADEARVMGLEPAAGKYRTLIVDPPWDFGGAMTGRGAVIYATLTDDEIAALPVPAWAEAECHLYLWCCNNNLPAALQICRAWGFEYKIQLIWVKPKIGMGHYFRNTTEPCLFATKGNLGTRVDDIPTHFEAPLGEHSAKPELFYDLVRRASFPSHGEAFQRTQREGFVGLFQEKLAA
jgi:N6-adenosine-specific RNA methylase IME4